MDAFGPLSAQFRDADRPVAPDAEVDWYASRIPPDALALDVMCGYGRLLAPLVARGRKVHGVDASTAMLARCGEKLTAAGASAPTFRQDVTRMNVPFRYGCAFVADAAFQLPADRWRSASFTDMRKDVSASALAGAARRTRMSAIWSSFDMRGSRLRQAGKNCQ